MANRQQANSENTDWERFTYVNDSPAKKAVHAPDSEPDQQANPSAPKKSPVAASSRRLVDVPVGDRVRIVALNCGDANNRFLGMGLAPGAILQVISSTASGSVIVALNHHRLGLGAEIAECVLVADLAPPESPPAGLGEENSSGPMNSDSTMIKLRDAAIGSTLKVIGYEPTAREYKRKLLAMGLTPGTELVVKRHAPLGDPTEIEVRGFRLSLRKAEADALVVEPVRR